MFSLPQFERLTGHAATPYLTRIVWGRLRLHWFHRGDADPDPHDHQWDFRTFPLTSYIEEVWSADGEPPLHIVVRAGAWSRRPASWRHRVIGRANGQTGPIVTICLTGPKKRAWGFWRGGEFIPWRTYFGMTE